MTDNQTTRQTSRISTCRLDPSVRKGRVKSRVSKSRVSKLEYRNSRIEMSSIQTRISKSRVSKSRVSKFEYRNVEYRNSSIEMSIIEQSKFESRESIKSAMLHTSLMSFLASQGNALMKQSRLIPSFDSGEWVKMKVVK